MKTILFVNKEVASLQCDVLTSGRVTLIVDAAKEKSIQVSPLPDGFIRIMVFGMNQNLFSGAFVHVDDFISSITNVVCADANAGNAHAVISKISSPANVVAETVK